jgi:RNA polymerase sigma-70 factor (ECF subfamily)
VLLDGEPGGLWAANGRPVIFFSFTIEGGKVVEIELVADPERLGSTKVEIFS